MKSREVTYKNRRKKNRDAVDRLCNHSRPIDEFRIDLTLSSKTGRHDFKRLAPSFFMMIYHSLD